MDWQKKVQDVQMRLQKEGIRGWLIFDFQKSNPLAWEFLQIPSEMHITRRIFYWIPDKGEPVCIVHGIEEHLLSYLPGKKQTYTSRESLDKVLRTLLANHKKIAMEYSPKQEIPYLSKVDAGLIEWICGFGIEVVSSGSLLQHYTAILDREQKDTHFAATYFLNQLAQKTWDKIGKELGKGITEYDVQQFMLQEMQGGGFVTEGVPICAVNEHSANPHFSPEPSTASLLKVGDFVLIDLWCKKKEKRAVYGDITRVAVIGRSPSAREQEIFALVASAQKEASAYVLTRHREGKEIRGCDVDLVCRSVIDKGGYGAFFTHRTGHNIYTSDHGPGAHLDSLETWDTRPLIAKTCFSIEPGIYLPNEFGIRLEYDLYLGDGGEGEITGGVQEEIICIR